MRRRRFIPTGARRIKPLEKDIQLAILHYLKAVGAYAGKTKTMGVYDSRIRKYRTDPWTLRGMADITGFFKKRLFFIEVKMPGGVRTDYQKEFEFRCREAKVPYLLARSVEDVENFINNYIDFNYGQR